MQCTDPMRASLRFRRTLYLIGIRVTGQDCPLITTLIEQVANNISRSVKFGGLGGPAAQSYLRLGGAKSKKNGQPRLPVF